ncbi:MAG TPA: tetratricopeptide repeat protein [Thermodesulfobacteriota bacterium]|nr:tetratricopeptide repeat protein [Thermodesulfobacteriota bacterium]
MPALVLLVALTLIVYWQSTGFDFQRYHDDEHYVTANPQVLGGLNGSSVRWAFFSSHAANWHPLTWISHMVDVDVYGMNPSGHHATNIFFHLANTLLLFLVLNRMTSEFRKSAFVAAVFALHPLHVESVAWVSERKDVLSTFFMLLTVAAYLRYAARPNVRAYLVIVLLFALALLSKQMVVTLPVVLLLLDWWPLNRFPRQGAWRLLKEKIPLLVLAGISAGFAFIAQESYGSVQSLEAYPWGARIENALVAYAAYIWKMFWPAGLAALYPLPVGGWPPATVIISGALLTGITACTVVGARRRPWLAVGWLWYIVTLLPVIGLIQVGEQAYADRYTYIPLVGLFIVVSWGVPEVIRRAAGRLSGRPLRFAAVSVIAILAVCSYVQVGYWKDSVTLFKRAIEAVPGNYLAEHELGFGLAMDRRLTEALPHMLRAVDIKPSCAQARFNYGVVLYKSGNYDEAARQVEMAERQGFKLATPQIRDVAEKIKRKNP